MKCRPARSTSRARLGRAGLAASLALAALLPGTGLPSPQSPILPPDAAARPYLEGRDLVEKGRYREAIPKLEEALATGHESPQERFGTSRHAVDFYDPHYWLGRALMELGEDARALRHFRASAAGGAFPDRRETEDRLRRVTELERREAARREPPKREPTPTPVPTAVPTPTTPAGLPTPEPRPPDPTPPPAPTAAALPSPVTVSPPASAPTPSPGRLAAILTALSAGEFERAASRVREERLRTPAARELDLLEAATLGARYVVEGRHDASLLASARASLAEFRKKGGSARAEAALLSPALRALLEQR